MNNWDRQYRLKAGVAGSRGFQVGEPDEHTKRALHINFSIEKTDGSALNTTKIQLWNLTKDQISILSKEQCSVELFAGYGDSRPCIFKGTVSLVTEDLDGSDRMVEFEVVDGFAELNDTYVSLSYSGKIQVKKILEDTASKLALPVRFSPKALRRMSSKYFSNGYAFAGKAKNVLTEMCNKAGVTWTIQNCVLQVVSKNETISKIVHKLSKETGLIGIPKRLYNSAVSASTDESGTESGTQGTLYGYEVTFFMNGAFCINDLVYLESKIVTGNFRISTLKIEGDNLSGDWQCTAELVEAGV